ncbi:KH domain-containing protein [Candidatus Uhrbacteria bacterium]|nr:KH domain-containing protein [Candidatus Uhrbacteria bacterium]
MVKALVDHPDEVHIKAIVGESVVLLELHVHAEDIGKVIGKKGQHAGALRTLLTAAAGKFKMQVRFEIVDPHFAERSVRLSSSRKARSAGSRHARS